MLAPSSVLPENLRPLVLDALPAPAVYAGLAGCGLCHGNAVEHPMPDLPDLNPLTAFAGMFQDPRSRWFVVYLLTALAIAFALFKLQARRDPELREEGFFAFAFPKEIYAHRSTRLDLWFYVVNKLAFTALFAATGVFTVVAFKAGSAVLGLLASGPLLPGHPVAAVATTTILSILATDFGLWLAHYLFHRVPVLWEFHKVHHSTEVLTPLSAGRVHPVDDLCGYAVAGSLMGVTLALCHAVFGPGAMVVSPFQLHIVLLVFYAAGFHLRHSHVWLPYTGLLGKILISPAHHQVHHSAEERHWDRNMGFIFAFWDWIFGTLHVPERERERFRLGIGGEEREYDSVWRLYWLPFAKAARRIRGAAPAADVAGGLGFKDVPGTDTPDPAPAPSGAPRAA